MIRHAKNSFYNIQLKEAGPYTRKIWSILNEVVDRKQCMQKIPAAFKVKGNQISDRKGIANAFNDYFATIGKVMADLLPTVPGFDEYLEQVDCRFQLEAMELDQVMEILKNQLPKLSCGLDIINNKVVKTCHQELAKPMMFIINKSI